MLPYLSKYILKENHQHNTLIQDEGKKKRKVLQHIDAEFQELIFHAFNVCF